MSKISIPVIGIVLFFTVTLFAGDKPNKAVELKIDAMNCPACAHKIKKALDSVEGVTETQIVLFSKLIKVTFDSSTVNESKLAKAVSSTGYKVTETHVCDVTVEQSDKPAVHSEGDKNKNSARESK